MENNVNGCDVRGQLRRWGGGGGGKGGGGGGVGGGGGGFFFFNDTATTEIYTLSLHDALPISHADPRLPAPAQPFPSRPPPGPPRPAPAADVLPEDRKSTRLNSSHLVISYAVFCLKKKI